MTPFRWRRFWAWPWELRRRGVLGINARNLALLARLNPRRLYPLLDDKVLTKRLCQVQGIPVPETYAVIGRYGDARRLADFVVGRPEFVVKPARGAGGRGILVIVGRQGDRFEDSKGNPLRLDDLRYHVSTTLSGLYSLGGRPDRAILEQRVRPHPVFRELAVRGTPDIRILVHTGTPVMAMVRLPTLASGGRANLHQGAVGAGVDMESGRLFGGVCRAQAVDAHPDTGQPIAGTVPHWNGCLRIAEAFSRAAEMGYIGVDLVLDADRGPLLLEANNRPGLAIQIANRCGLGQRLTRQPPATPEPSNY